MLIAKRLFARAAGATLVLLALPSLAAANPGTGPELVQRSGRLVVVHADRSDGTSTQHWALANGTNHLPVRAPADVWIDPGTPVTLEGTLQAGTLVLADSLTAVERTGPSPLAADAGQAGSAQAPARSAQAPVTPGMHTTAVILFGFRPGGPTSNQLQTDRNAVNTLMFGDPASTPNSLNAYYLEQTYGQVGFAGTVFGPYDIGPAGGCGDAAVDSWAAQAEAKANISDTAYQHYVFIFPQVSACNWAGLAEIGGTHSWINGRPDVSVLAHELGHNLGLAHAGGLKCTTAGAPSPMGDACDPAGYEYLDPFDAMGQSDVGSSGPVLRQMSMQHKLALGLVPPAAVQVAGLTGTYRIAPMETLTGAAEVLRLPKPGGGNYYIEYRQPIGWFDRQSPAFKGVYIRTESPEVDASGNTANADTALIDMHPTTGSRSAPWSDAKMTLGQVFSDPLRGITIQDVAEDVSGATVAIGVPLDTTVPGAPGGLTAVATGTSVALQWTPATDNYALGSYRVTRNAVQIGVTDTATLSFGDAGLPPGAVVTYAVAAVDLAGNAGIPASVNVTIPDTSPPSVPPKVAAKVTRDGRVHVSWKASTDDSRVASYRILRSGKGIAQATKDSFVDTRPRPGKGATVIYSVVAMDVAGNASAPGRARPVRAALLRKLGASHLKVVRLQGGTAAAVDVEGVVSDSKAVCRVRAAGDAWHRCKTTPRGRFSVRLPVKEAKRLTLSLRDQLGRMKQKTLRVP